MKFFLGEIRNMKQPMIALLDKDIPIKSAWKLTKLVKAFDKELSEIEEFRIGLVKRLGVADETGNLQVPETSMNDFINKFNDLLATEVEIEFESISIDDLAGVQASAKDLIALDKIFN